MKHLHSSWLTRRVGLGAFFLVVVAAGATSAGTNAQDIANARTRAYVPSLETFPGAAFAPIFLVERDDVAHNRIGTPSARLKRNGGEEIYVDAEVPSIYYASEAFEAGGREYANHIYRVHFELSPFSLFPFNAGAGKNVGAMVIVTVDDKNHPVLVNTVQSCGCYHAIVPTDYLPDSAMPEKWDLEKQDVYGEQLPGLLSIVQSEFADGRVVVTIRADSHRIGDVAWTSESDLRGSFEMVAAALKGMEALESLPVGDHTTSFFHTSGHRRGLVKGAWKPWETLLFGAIAFDTHVGQDRAYGEKTVTGRRFYTTLQGWNKKDADMAHYADYLAYNGWQL